MGEMMDVKIGSRRDRIGEEGRRESIRGEKGAHKRRRWQKAREECGG